MVYDIKDSINKTHRRRKTSGNQTDVGLLPAILVARSFGKLFRNLKQSFFVESINWVNALMKPVWRQMAFLIFNCTLLFAQPGRSIARETGAREDFVAWAKANAKPIRTVENDLKDDELQSLKPMVGPARVVALGEPSHGAHEPLVFRNRLFKFLVEQMGFTAIATESSLTDSKAIAEFIAGKSEDLPSIGQLPSAENQELLIWIRAYNADSSHIRKVSFYGIDLGLSGLGNAYPAPPPMRAALDYAAKIIPDAVGPVRAKLEPYFARLPGPGDRSPSFSKADHDALTGLIEDLIGLLERERPRLIAASSKAAYEWAHRNAVVARQADQVFRVSPAEARPNQIPREAWRSMTARDTAMADNILWALNQEGPAGRILFVAHNAHIKAVPTTGGVWDAFETPPNATGQYLRATLGDDLVILGMSAGRAEIRPSPAPAKFESFDSALGEVRATPFLLDLRTASAASSHGKWLAETKTLIANGQSFLELSPRQAFDVMFYVQKLTDQHPPVAR